MEINVANWIEDDSSPAPRATDREIPVSKLTNKLYNQSTIKFSHIKWPSPSALA